MSDANAATHSADRLQFDAWPPALLDWFDGRALLARTGFAASLVTCHEDGRFGTSLLGIGELYASGPRSLRFALWAQARAARALAAGGRAALTFVFDGAFFQVQLDAMPIESTGAQGVGLACFEAVVASGEAQRVPYAQLDAGITFTLDERDREMTLERWNQQIEWLKAVGR
ncbi:hypothetical protein BJG93_04725 [Paraburkholderia sprentiae WSM5005]|uniref:Uncharacterized protein n=1 Tax=Paraburkholderia sprentiae WSM5005 TaxID=754502 RepID=A0A1I9YKS8_9BURK|nr:hypothetical protein [Paraburkholderia sprentiae]APA86911.1 hypothetical protein BJG93_04725 [Paraburkholderia sprentiae WSM5005]